MQRLQLSFQKKGEEKVQIKVKTDGTPRGRQLLRLYLLCQRYTESLLPQRTARLAVIQK